MDIDIFTCTAIFQHWPSKDLIQSKTLSYKQQLIFNLIYIYINLIINLIRSYSDSAITALRRWDATYALNYSCCTRVWGMSSKCDAIPLWRRTSVVITEIMQDNTEEHGKTVPFLWTGSFCNKRTDALRLATDVMTLLELVVYASDISRIWWCKQEYSHWNIVLIRIWTFIGAYWACKRSQCFLVFLFFFLHLNHNYCLGDFFKITFMLQCLTIYLHYMGYIWIYSIL